MNKKIKAPIYDTTESLTQYLRKVENFELQLKKEKYDFLLEFINKWLKLDDNIKLQSLCSFRNIYENKLLSDITHNNNILKMYSSKIKCILNINIDDIDIENIKDKYIIYFIRKALTTINYKLKCKTIDNKKIYSIIIMKYL